jgi:hypothetical protein
VGGYAPGITPQVFHLNSQAFNKMPHITDVADTRHIVEGYRLFRQQAGSQQGQGGILVPAGRDLPLQGMTSFDDKLFHDISCKF